MRWLERRRKQARRRRVAEVVSAADAWRPALGNGPWRVWYAECADAVLAFDRIVATLPPGPVRDGVQGCRGDLLPLLDAARRLAELGAYLDPAGPGRSRGLRAALEDDPIGAAADRLVGQSPTARLRDRVQALRDELAGIADEAARVGVRLHEHPAATDVGTWLEGLAAGIDQANRAGWIPAAYRSEERS